MRFREWKTGSVERGVLLMRLREWKTGSVEGGYF